MHEFDEPTEPMSQVFLPPHSAPTFKTNTFTEQYAIPSPQLDEVPFPKSSGSPVNVPGLSAVPPLYPILQPAAPTGPNRNRRSPGVAPQMPEGKPDTFVQRQKRRSSFPALVGMFFLAVEFLLLLRLLFSLFAAPISNMWVEFVYTVSTFFLLPFFFLLQNVKIPLINGTEFYSDLIIVGAIFVYGFLSRILVRFFKALLN